MYKIVHLATGNAVVGPDGEELCFFSLIELETQVLENRYVMFRRKYNDPDIIEVVPIPNGIIPEDDPRVVQKYQFEIFEDIGIWNV
jgi:hypothetical protein